VSTKTIPTLDEVQGEYEVQEVPSDGGHFLACTCAWALKHKGTGICRHVARVIRNGWDAWDPDNNKSRLMANNVIVPIFAHRQGQHAIGEILFVKMILPNPAGLVSPVHIESLGDPVTYVNVGTLAPGEGRAVLREVLVNWLYGEEEAVQEFECRSPYHNGELMLNSPGWFIRNAFTILTSGVCYLCTNDVGIPTDDL
jgi:hypothetical protein